MECWVWLHGARPVVPRGTRTENEAQRQTLHLGKKGRNRPEIVTISMNTVLYNIVLQLEQFFLNVQKKRSIVYNDKLNTVKGKHEILTLYISLR